MFSFCIARGKALLTIIGMSYIFIVLLGVSFINWSQAELTCFFNGPKTDRSNGCSLWLQWGGKDMIVTPFSLAIFRTSTDRCDSWLSNNSTTGLSLEHLVFLIKCLINRTKFSSVIQPDLVAAPSEPGAPPPSRNKMFFINNPRE